MRNGVMDTQDWQIMWGMAHKYDVKSRYIVIIVSNYLIMQNFLF